MAARLVWERAPLYNPALGRPLSWAVVITRNKAIDRLRTLQRESEAIAKITAQAAADFVAYGRKPPGEAIGTEECNILRCTLSSLPTEQRIAIELAFFTGLSQTQISAQLGQPLGTIKARIRRGIYPGCKVMLIALAPGAKVPDHDHAGSEEIYMLTGHLHTEGQVLGPGDFVRAEAGTHHHEVISPDGCTALLILGPTLTE